ncbi:MAG TPA: GNAT family N-acetyltransferase [Streptosporangiaceae bacterium]
MSRRGWTSEADLVEGDRIDIEQVKEIIDGPDSVLLVLDEGGLIVACCQLEDRGGSLAYFGTFAVSPFRQGKGLGRCLMTEAERWAAATFGSTLMEITVLAQQKELISWYERLGFIHTGEVRSFPADSTFARPLRDDLYFVVLSKRLVSGTTAPKGSISSKTDSEEQ